MNFFDLHADTPLILDEKTSNSSVVKLKNHPFDIYKQVMAIFIRDGDKTPFESYKRRVSLIKSHLKNSEFPFLKHWIIDNNNVDKAIPINKVLSDL